MNKSSHSHPSITRRKAAFLTSTVLLAVLFAVAVLGILTGKLRPFADESPKVSSKKTITIQGGKLQYRAGKVAGQDFVGEVTAPEISLKGLPLISSLFALQGISDLKLVKELNGTVIIAKSDKTVIATAKWASLETDDKKPNLRKVSFVDDILNQNVGKVSGPLTILVKPNCRLARAVRNIADIYTPVVFDKEMLAGDVDNNNVVDEADYAAWIAKYEKPNPSICEDANNDKVANESDFAIMFTTNFGKAGDGI